MEALTEDYARMRRRVEVEDAIGKQKEKKTFDNIKLVQKTPLGPPLFMQLRKKRGTTLPLGL